MGSPFGPAVDAAENDPHAAWRRAQRELRDAQKALHDRIRDLRADLAPIAARTPDGTYVITTLTTQETP